MLMSIFIRQEQKLQLYSIQYDKPKTKSKIQTLKQLNIHISSLQISSKLLRNVTSRIACKN